MRKANVKGFFIQSEATESDTFNVTTKCFAIKAPTAIIDELDCPIHFQANWGKVWLM